MKKVFLMASVLAVTLLCAVMLFALPASAEVYSGNCGTQGDNVKWSLDTRTGVLAITGNGAMEEFESAPSWYAYRDSIQTVTIGNGVTSISMGAFYDCGALTNVMVPNSVTSIGMAAFTNCKVLTGIVIPDNVTSIGEQAFYLCEALTSIIIPDSVTSLGGGAFMECTALESATIGNGVKSIGDYAFYGCYSMVRVTLGKSVASLGEYVFVDCDALADITVDQRNTAYCAIDGNLYTKNPKVLVQYAVGKTSTAFVVPDGVVGIGDGAVANNYTLKTVTMPDTVTSIGVGAFAWCEALTSVTLSDNLKSIGDEAFTRCGMLKSLVIPDGVTSIGSTAFRGCNDLTSVTIPNSVTRIGERAFYSCDALVSVVIPDQITSIASETFSGCTLLTSVTIGKAVTSIGNDAFKGCYCLVEVYNKSSLNIVVGEDDHGGVASYAKNVYTKAGGSKLSTTKDGLVLYTDGSAVTLIRYIGTDTVVVIPEGVTMIGDRAFYMCDSLLSVTIADSVTGIGKQAFYYCTSLVSVTVGKNITRIDNDSFGLCMRLVEVYNRSNMNITAGRYNTIGEFAKNIYTEAGGSKLSATDDGLVLYTDGNNVMVVHYIGPDAGLVIPDYVTSINGYAFYSHDTLRGVFVPKSVTDIGDHAFSGLLRVCYEGTEAEWNEKVTVNSDDYLSEALSFEHAYGDYQEHNDAQHKQECACGMVLYEDHKWGEDATVTENGEKLLTCQDCGATKETHLPSTNEPEQPADQSSSNEENAPIWKRLLGGCKSVVGSSSVILISVLGAAMLTKKKKED